MGVSADIFFYEAFEEEAVALRRHLPGHCRAGFASRTIQEAGAAEPPARLISIRTQSIIPPAWWAQLAGVVSRTTGYDHLAGSPVPCGHLPLYCNRAVAEQAALLWLALLRKLPAQMKQFTTFHRDGITGNECAGKNLLVVGVGHIGSEVVSIGRGLGMNVRRVDVVPERADTTLAEGLPWADVVVCAMNLTATNRDYFRYEVLLRARRGLLLVNVARGEFTPIADMVRLLEEGWLGGVALDVFEDEPRLATAMRAGQPTQVLRLAEFPNVILTPHNAFNTREAVDRKAQQTAQQVEEFLRTGRFLWPVP